MVNHWAVSEKREKSHIDSDKSQFAVASAISSKSMDKSQCMEYNEQNTIFKMLWMKHYVINSTF